jgi:hypothetical protein
LLLPVRGACRRPRQSRRTAIAVHWRTDRRGPGPFPQPPNRSYRVAGFRPRASEAPSRFVIPNRSAIPAPWCHPGSCNTNQSPHRSDSPSIRCPPETRNRIRNARPSRCSTVCIVDTLSASGISPNGDCAGRPRSSYRVLPASRLAHETCRVFSDRQIRPVTTTGPGSLDRTLANATACAHQRVERAWRFAGLTIASTRIESSVR